MSEGGIIVESDGLAQRGFDPSEHRQHDRNGLSGGLASEPGGERHAGFALMENEHRPCALTNDEVALPMAALGSAVDSLGPFVDGDAILDGILRSSPSAWPAAFVTTREITPQLLGPLGCPIDKGIDLLSTALNLLGKSPVLPAHP